MVELVQLLRGLLQLGLEGLPFLGGKLLHELQKALEVAFQGAEGVYGAPEAGGLLAHLAGGLGIVPEGGVLEAPLQLF